MRLYHETGMPCTIGDLAQKAYANCHVHGPSKQFPHPMTKTHGYRMLKAENLDAAIVVLWKAFSGIPNNDKSEVEPDLKIVKRWFEKWGLRVDE